MRISLALSRPTANVFSRIKYFGNIMHDALDGAKQRLACEIESNFVLQSKPIAADPWVISSLLQKSIRRGEVEIAQRAALTFWKFKGAAIRRRLIVIAFEDVGIGDVDTLATTVSVGSDSAWRKQHGSDVVLAVQLAGALAVATKDRSADYLCQAKDHPALADFVQAMGNASLEARLSTVRDKVLDLPQRAAAALSVLSTGSRGEISRTTNGLDELLVAFRELGVPQELLVATGMAAAKTREAITVMVPLIWLAANNSQGGVCDCSVPPLVKAGEIPLYALDKHTRFGREAIWRFACENQSVRSCLARFVPAIKARSAAYVAAFYVDAAPIARRLIWDQSERLEAFGIERDLLHAGVSAAGIQPLLKTMRANLGHLNELRAEVLAPLQRASIGQASWADVR
jgi:hypothetical protein